MTKGRLKDAALEYATRYGWKVFPLIPGEKRPATKTGFKEATQDPAIIAKWWNENPDYNVGVSTGKDSSGFFVIDLDEKPEKEISGQKALAAYCSTHGRLPDTVISQTGGGGRHLLFTSPSEVKCKTGIVPGVDLRGTGGYIVAPPSVVNGREYRWISAPDQMKIAEADEKVMAFIAGEKKRYEQPQQQYTPISGIIPEGQRVTTLVSMLGSMQAKGFADDVIRTAIRSANNLQCAPPLSEKELEKEVFPALSRFPKGTDRSFRRTEGRALDWDATIGDGRRGEAPVLYRLPELTGAETVYLVEGEKDVDNLRLHGLTATCSPDGAGPDKWKPEFYNEPLRGKKVIILMDNDDTGRDFGEQEARALYGVAASVKLIDLREGWDDLREHDDISDILARQDPKYVLTNLEALVMQTPEYAPGDVFGREDRPPAKTFSTISARELQEKELEPPRYVVAELLPQGLALLASPPKYGKSWWVLDLCLSVAAGKQFLDHDTVKCGCLYLALEDSEYRLKDRMNKVLNYQRAPDGFDYATAALDIGQGLMEQLENYMKAKPDTGLIVIDTLQKVRGQTSGKESAYSTDYREMSILKRFADKHRVCLLLVHHLRKMGDDTDPMNRISGTNGLLGAADTAFVMSRAKRGDDQTLFSITGRDIESRDIMLQFSDYHWRVLGDRDWLEEERARLEYEGSYIVSTIRDLVEEAEGHSWAGTMTELMTEGEHRHGVKLARSPKGLSNKVKALDKRLLEYDGIVHERKKNGQSGGAVHRFFYPQDPVDEEEDPVLDG